MRLVFISGHIPELEVAQKITTEKKHPATENHDWQKEERVFLEFSDHKCREVTFKLKQIIERSFLHLTCLIKVNEMTSIKYQLYLLR